MESEPFKSLRFSKLLDYYDVCLTDKQADAAKSFFNDDLSLGEIAETTGTSRQAVRDNIKRAEATMIELEDKLHLAEKSGRFYDFCDAVEAQLSALSDEIRPGCNIINLRGKVRGIQELLEKNKDLF
jgi:predicted DNA-binding protein YlxM (UPF0122 family)